MSDLPVNIDTTYPDDGSDATVAEHQQHHDAVHALYNALVGATPDPASVNVAPLVSPPFKTGLYYTDEIGEISSFGTTGDQLRVHPFVVPRQTSFDAIAVYCTTAGGAGAVVRLGIYADTGSSYPGSLIVDAGTVSTESTGVKGITIAQTLDPGLYWLGACPQVATGANFTSRQNSFDGRVGLTAPGSNTVGFSGFVQSSVSGALPSTFTTTAANEKPPVVWLRVA